MRSSDPRFAIGVWSWRILPVFVALLVAVYAFTIRTMEDPRLPLALKSAREDWFIVEVLTGKRM